MTDERINIEPTSQQVLADKVERLRAHAPAWAATAPRDRAALLRQCMVTLQDVSDAWVQACCEIKGYAAGSNGHGEEYLGGVLAVMRNLRLFAEALEHEGQPPIPKTFQRENGQWVARVFPQSLIDKALFAGTTVDVWIQPDKKVSQGELYRTGTSPTQIGAEGGVCVVLGAGNQSSIPAMDVLYKLVVDNEVCILKMNPVNEAVGPYIERALTPLVDAGFLEVCYGGVEQGQYLTDHQDVNSVHITGSARAHDAIVWGVGEQGERNRAANTPRLAKHISSELGAVGPVFVVPGPWSDKAIDHHARNVVAMVTYNAGFNCNGARLIVTASGWPQREAFVARVEHHLNATPSRTPYYPRAAETLADFTQRYPQHICSPVSSEDHLPWTLLKGISTDPSEYALRNEPWAGLTSHVELKAADAADFLSAMVAFGNDHCAGTLATQILIDPKTERAHQERFDRALEGLRFGLIGINCWSGLGYGIVNATWGAFPGHPLSNIESGQGVVHNGLLLDHPEKSVVRTPFIMSPTPAWFTDHRNNVELGRKMVAFEAAPSWWKVPGIAAAALRG